LQQELDFSVDCFALAVGKEFGAVAALQEEGIAESDVA
jgi:hypothetical protein